MFGKLILETLIDILDGSDEEESSESDQEILENEEQNTESGNIPLFFDRTFQGSKALGEKIPSDDIIWLRPHEISDQPPKMYVDGSSQRDIKQGELGDCWLLAAMATISQHQELLERVCPDQTFDFKEGYNGQFKIRFWQYGNWVEVTIDDRLPTRDGKLIFVHSDTNNEFWPALVEKAYAKLNYSYSNLSGGHGSEGMVDLTGGTSEYLHIRDDDDQLKLDIHDIYEKIKDCLEEQALITCAIKGVPGETEAQKENGLVCGHAYSITGAEVLLSGDETYHCVRVRNPWGQHEWKGAFSDKDPIWDDICFQDHNEIHQETSDLSQLRKNDGEFWMSIQDFTENFHTFEICRLNMSDFESEGRWIERILSSQWSNSPVDNQLEGTAGGCTNHETFCNNPFMIFSVSGEKESDECIISLSQKHRRRHKKSGSSMLTIGFCVFKIDDAEVPNLDGDVENCSLGEILNITEKRVFSTTFTNLRTDHIFGLKGCL